MSNEDKRTAVVIEDDRMVRTLLERLLTRHMKITVHPAEDGRSGLEAIQRFKPDFVLLDVHLPDMSGVEVLQKIREDQSLSKLPVVVISSEQRTVILNAFMSLGVSDYVLKPVSVGQLIQRVGKVIEELEA